MIQRAPKHSICGTPNLFGLQAAETIGELLERDALPGGYERDAAVLQTLLLDGLRGDGLHDEAVAAVRAVLVALLERLSIDKAIIGDSSD